MMRMHKMKTLTLLLAALMIFSSAGCSKKADHSHESTTESTTAARQSNPDYVKEDVVLPENFGNMIYPMEALLIEAYAKGLPYYTSDSDEEDADSFWFSMAVLTSQMNHYVKDVAVKTDDGYIYIDEETLNMYAAGLYDEFGKGNMEFPELDEEDKYAVYDNDKGMYGFRQGTIGDLEPYITDCRSKDDSYVLTLHLKNTDSAEILSSCKITLVPTSYESEDNAFNYSVAGFKKLKSSDLDELSEKDSTEDVTDEDEDDDNDEDSDSSERISRSDAQDLAEDYFGEDATYSYKKIVKIGEYDYYDFAVEGEGISSTDVLVSLDGENVMGGEKNDDGTWTFDQ